MPRGQPTAKRQPGVANQRDSRHDAGIVTPGKRIQPSKQKSNGHSNGHPKQPDSNCSTPPLPATPPPANGHARQHPLSDSQPATVHKMAGPVRRPSFGAYSESSSSESYHNNAGLSPENHRRIDVNATKNPAVHRDLGPFNLALTVLRSCPLYDTIAILIVLLQLPPTFLSLVHLLFATLTFVPPSNSTTSGLSFTDVFEGTLGTPSVATIVVVDLFVLMVWLFLWSPLQDVALDLAQTVIALTLGGGTSGREAGLRNVLVCFGLIASSHFARNGNVKQSGFRAILSSTSSMGSSDPDDPLEPVSHGGSKKNAHGWVRSILAIHILAQGLVRFVRDLYIQRNLREKRDTATSISDPEAGKTLADNASETSNSIAQTTENDSSIPLNATTTINSKKKRKQSAQVRVRQPLWAALASTKIVMVKEYETSHTAAESAGTNATDINNLGNAPFNAEADRIWITYVGSDAVSFSTSYFPQHTQSSNLDERRIDSLGVDRSKPFFVRVNKTVWHATKIKAMINPDKLDGQDMRWTGEIFGLAPATDFECEFVSTVDDTVLFSSSVWTMAPPSADTSIGLSPNPQVPRRPGSPTTTLKTSIASSELKLTEERNRQKRERKELRAKVNAIKKEIDKLANSISSSGGNDDRVKQKIQQNNLQQKQAEDALVGLTAEIKALEVIPLDDAAQYSSCKVEYKGQTEKQKHFRSEVNSTRQNVERDLSNLNNELSNIQQKYERAQTRVNKLASEHERITDANARGLDEAQRKENMRQANHIERAKLEGMYLDRLNGLTGQVAEATTSLQLMYGQIENMQRQEIYATASPTTSVPNLHANNGYGSDMMIDHSNTTYSWNAAAMHNPGNMYSQVPYGPPPSMPIHTSGTRTRGRSSSMLSNLSGFTQSDEEVTAPMHPFPVGQATWGHYDAQRHGSTGSGSGAGSLGDPKSPLVGNGIMVAR
ncbi:hypothetical protein HYFRA_00013899 [Hymenoscyphus fraxineus]|uniref:Ubiquitination network signaling protein n=1 Tax=Hymenoscyphus fraxineus TaxID=746836 RepID=A0A9N9L9A8_9HELO|nr:hypothetical protein HYFRA_00013899 [Hymenoscyphus fraxineus]